MVKAFDELPGWLFSVQETSPMAYTVTGSDEIGHKINYYGPEDELPLLLEKCLTEARSIMERIPKDRWPPVTTKTFDDLPGWLFEIDYFSAENVGVTGRDPLGHAVRAAGMLVELDRVVLSCRIDARHLIDEIRETALKQRELGKGR